LLDLLWVLWVKHEEVEELSLFLILREETPHVQVNLSGTISFIDNDSEVLVLDQPKLEVDRVHVRRLPLYHFFAGARVVRAGILGEDEPVILVRKQAFVD